jgi:hypothetical protein
VWIVTLGGAGFASVQPTSAPYLTGQLLPQGTLLDNYSPLAATTLAQDAELLSGQIEPKETSLQAPSCSPANGTPACTPGSAGELTREDTYLSQTLPAILASSAYREHGLIAIVFASSAAATSNPTTTGSVNALGATPPGALLLSPFLRSATRNTTPFHPASPRKDLERLFKSTA